MTQMFGMSSEMPQNMDPLKEKTSQEQRQTNGNCYIQIDNTYIGIDTEDNGTHLALFPLLHKHMQSEHRLCHHVGPSHQKQHPGR